MFRLNSKDSLLKLVEEVGGNRRLLLLLKNDRLLLQNLHLVGSRGGLRVFHIGSLHVVVAGDLTRTNLRLSLVLRLLTLLLLSGEHVHAVSAHEDWAEVTHILGLSDDILWYSEHYSIGHHLVLLRLLLTHDNLLRSCLLRLAELTVLVHDDIVGLTSQHSIDLLNSRDTDNSIVVLITLTSRRQAYHWLLGHALTVDSLLSRDCGRLGHTIVLVTMHGIQTAFFLHITINGGVVLLLLGLRLLLVLLLRLGLLLEVLKRRLHLQALL